MSATSTFFLQHHISNFSWFCHVSLIVARLIFLPFYVPSEIFGAHNKSNLFTSVMIFVFYSFDKKFLFLEKSLFLVMKTCEEWFGSGRFNSVV